MQLLLMMDIRSGDANIVDYASDGDLSLVEKALDNGEEVNCTADEGGLTPLHYACDRGHVDVVKLLLARGANITALDEGRQTPLHYAVSNDFLEVVRLLAAEGADFSMEDEDGNTPVDVAVGETARFLETLGVKIPQKS